MSHIASTVMPTEAELRRMVAITPVGLYRQDAQGYCLYVNPAWCELSGLTEAASLGLGWRQAVHPDDLERVMSQWNGQQPHPAAHALEYRLVHADGRVVWVLDHTQPEFDATGQLLGFVGTVTDVTSLKTTVNALYQTETYLRGLLAALPDLIFYLDRVGVFKDAYFPASFRASAKPTDYIGRHINEVLPPVPAMRLRQAMQAVAISGETQMMEYVVGEAAFEAWVSAVADSHFMVVVRNVTARKQAEQAFNQRTNYLAALAESTQAIINALDRNTVLNVVLDSATRILNTPHAYISVFTPDGDIQSLAGSGIFAPYVGRRFSPTGGLAGQVLSTGLAACVNDYPNWSNRLQPLYHHAPIQAGAAVPLHLRGRLEGVLAAAYLEPKRLFNHDALEIMRRFAELVSLALEKADLYHNLQQQRDELQTALARADAFAQAASAANHAKSQFLTITSHEVRNPLHVIQAWSRELAAGANPGTGHDLAQRIAAESAWLLALTEDLLDLAKIEAGRFSLQKGVFDLRATVDDVLAVQRWRAQPGVTLHANVAANVPSHLRGDVRRLRQILLNLVSNATKHTATGTVTVHVRLAQVAPLQLRFEVQDTGPGLSETDMARLFQPFVTLANQPRLHPDSHGLGLAIARQLAELMGGHMGVNSTLGQGATFWFTAQFEPALHTPPALTLSPEARLLLVDDQPTNTVVLASLLQQLGYSHVHIAHTAGQAVQHFEAGQPFDLVFVDMHLDDMHGLELAHQVRLWEHFHGLPRARLVAVTAAEWEAGLAAEFDAWLPKPFTTEQLAETLTRSVPLQHLPSAVRLLPEYATLVEVFLENGGTLMRQLEAALAAANVGEVKQLAHALRGTALNMGVSTLAYWADLLEHAATLPEAAAVWPALQTAWQAVRTELAV